MAEAIDFVRF